MHVPPLCGHRAALLLTLASLLAVAESAALAQSPCEAALQVAQQSYELGLFEDIPGQLEPCLKGQSSRAESVRAQALLAQAYIAMDQLDKAREAVAELLRIDPAYEPGPPPQLVRLVEQIRREEEVIQVASVSKTSESLREAPATVVVIRADEIEQRGYLDLEQVLHDLPGFDISRGNGETYSNFYQRGFRSKDNDRILLLVDGVEQNDLTTSVAHLSRQYPVSNIDRIEVVYGPASTIYGANAYSGVINIITKPAEAFIPQGKSFGFLAQATAGSFGTRSTDLTLAGRDRNGSMAWSVTGRFYRSDEMDLSGIPGWSYDFGTVPYRDLLRLEGEEAELFCEDMSCGDAEPSPFFTVSSDEEGNVLAVDLTEAGAQLARELDEALGLEFSDPTEDWSLYAKLRLSNLTLGLQTWRRKEGTLPWFNAEEQGPATWTPEQSSLFVHYGRSLGKNLSLTLFTRYRQSDLDPRRSGESELFTYANGSLRLWELIGGCDVGTLAPQIEIPCKSSKISPVPPRRLSTQSTAEITLVYAPHRKFTLVSGFDLRKGSIQTREDVVNQLVDHFDAGVYAQASYKPLPRLSLVAGGRLDYNESRSPDFPRAGFGPLLSPRLAVIYLLSEFTLKAIYSEAFKDPSDFEKFSQDLSGFSRIANPRLQPERTRNLELSLGWAPDDETSLELVTYRTRYNDLVDLGFACVRTAVIADAGEAPLQCQAFEILTRQFQNLGRLEVRGLELRAGMRFHWFSLSGNVTFIDPVGTEPAKPEESTSSRPSVRVGDIARHRANLIFDLSLARKMNLDLRVSHVGPRPTGEGTTVSTNPFRRIDSYTVAHSTLTYRDVLPGTDLQLIVQNLLDKEYFDPGVLDADGTIYAARLPQPGRTVFLRLSFGVSRGGRPLNPPPAR
jgi:outer membrane receptor protein involved in Fe transport